MKKSFAFLFALCIIAFACTKDGDILQEDLSDSALLKSKVKTKTIKFHRASGPFIYEFPSDCGEGIFRAVISGQGNASHLGRFTVENIGCFHQDSEGDLVLDGPWLGFMTAANGDEIHTQLVGAWDKAGLSYYKYMVLTGTGRFFEAQGEIIMYGTMEYETPLSGNWTLKGEGTLILSN